jgi:hypothetical protein
MLNSQRNTLAIYGKDDDMKESSFLSKSTDAVFKKLLEDPKLADEYE